MRDADTAIIHTMGEQLRSLLLQHVGMEDWNCSQAMTQPHLCSVLFEWVATNRTDGPVVVGVGVVGGVGGVVVVVG